MTRTIGGTLGVHELAALSDTASARQTKSTTKGNSVMKLSDFATDLVAGNRFVKAGFGGFAGAGKSRTASEFVIGAYKALGYTKPVLVIDNEKGSRFLIPLFRRAGIHAAVKDTTSLDDVLTAFKLLAAGEVEVLFIDSLTKVWYRYVREYLEKNRKVFMELQDWGKLLPKWQETFSDVFVSAQGSIVFTGRGGFSYEKEEDTTDPATGKVKKGQFVKSGVKMKLAGETPFEPDLNVWMEQQQAMRAKGLEVWREAHIMKDRSGTIDGKVFKNPTYEDFKPFIEFLTSVDTGAVKARRPQPYRRPRAVLHRGPRVIEAAESRADGGFNFPGARAATTMGRHRARKVRPR